MAIGIYKVKNGWANQDSVSVKYSDGTEMNVSEELYISKGYEPPISELEYKLEK